MTYYELQPEDSYRISALAQQLGDTVQKLRAHDGETAEVPAAARRDIAALLETLVTLLFPLKATHLDPHLSLRIPPVLVDRLREDQDEPGEGYYWQEVPRVVTRLRSPRPALKSRDVMVLGKVAEAVDREASGGLARATHR